MTYRERLIRRLIRTLVGKRVRDGGQWGHLVRCAECGGGGLLHDLEPEEREAMNRARDEVPPLPA